MTWCGLEGHDEVVERFRRALQLGRLASTFLFCGPPGVGKRRFAGHLAQGLLCDRRPEIALDPCLACDACVQVQAQTHPDVDIVSKPADRAYIPLDLLIGDADHRAREGLCHRLALKPMRGRRRVAILDDADYLNDEGANALLKTLEEPPRGAILILIGTSPQRQLPTIRSRCQLVRFAPLPLDFVAQKCLSSGWASELSAAQALAAEAGGSLERACTLADSALRAFRSDFLTRMRKPTTPPWELAQMLEAFVEAAGKEAPVRRQRLKLVLSLFVDEYRGELARLVESGERGAGGSLDTSAAIDAVGIRLERTLDAWQHVEANANITSMIECLIDDLRQDPPGRFEGAWAS